MNTEMRHSVATSTHDYLDALAKTHKHSVQRALDSLFKNAQLLGQQIGDVKNWVAQPEGPGPGRPAAHGSAIEKIIDELQQTQLRIRQIHREVSSYSADFIKDISGYDVEAPIVLRDLINSAINLAHHCLLRGEVDQIKVSVVWDTSLPSTHVYGSTLIKQHLYSILHNAVEATFDRMEGNGEPGRIVIRIEEGKLPEGQERRPNKALIVRIRDNGAGVSEKQLTELNKFEVGNTFKPGGRGYGLVAAHRYFHSIGGLIELSSVEGEYFEVAIYLEEDMTEPEDQPPRGSEDGVDG